jgi:hypothetical protein
VIDGTDIWTVYKEHKSIRPAARSPAVAATITALARRRWHTILDPYQRRCLYLDTDSAYLVGSPEQYPGLPLDGELGNLKIEATFSEFHGFAPKVYGYRKADGKCEVRAKGQPMGGSFARDPLARTLTTERPGKLPCNYPEHGLEFLQALAEGYKVQAKRPVSFALAGAELPGSWITVERSLHAGPDAGRVWTAGMVRTTCPAIESEETAAFSGDNYENEED